MERWKTSHTCVYHVAYHIIFCPKYRRKVLVGQVVERLEALIREKSASLGVNVEELQSLPDHLHLFVKMPPTIPVHSYIGQVKGYTSRILRQEFPTLKSRLPSLWTRSYYVESIGHISEETIRRYIEAQKGN